MDLWDSCIEIEWERRPFPPCALRVLNSWSISYVSCLCLWRFFISFVWSWSTRLVWFFELFDVILIPLAYCKTSGNPELSWIEVFAFLRKPRSCSRIRRFLPNHGVIRRFLRWVCSQCLCDRACKFWWDLNLFWSSDRQVSDRTESKNRISASGWVFTYHWLNRRLW